MRAFHNGIPLSIYAYKTRKQELHQGFFLSLFGFQLTLMKGDKVVDISQNLADAVLFS